MCADIHDGQEHKRSVEGRIQKRKTNHLQIITFGLQRTAGPYKRATTGLVGSYSIILALLQEVFKAACASVRGREAPPDFLLAHVFTPAGAISMGTMARKLMRPQ